MKKRYRHAQNLHITVVLSIVAAIVMVSLLFGSISSRAGSDRNIDTGRTKRYTSVYIQEGDTLWTIAENYITEEYSGLDEYVDELKQINHVGNTIHAGRYLTVMYYADTEQ